MKIKTDFTTNSSSSSFVVWGMALSEACDGDFDIAHLKAFKEYLDICKNSDVDYKKKYVEEMESLTEDEDKIQWAKDNWLLGESIGKLSVGGNIEYSEEEGLSVGLNPQDLLHKYPEMRLGEIKKFVADLINETFDKSFTEEDIAYIEEGWYNG